MSKKADKMKRYFTLKGLECPHYAGKIEKSIRALPDIKYAEINLVRQLLTVESAEPVDALASHQEPGGRLRG